MPDDDRDSLTADVRAAATRLGFDLVGVAAAGTPDSLDAFKDWLSAGFEGEMQYLPRREAAYEHPSNVLPEVRSLIVVGLNYFSRSEVADSDEPAHRAATGGVSTGGAATGRVARYARGTADYHDVIRARLKLLAALLHERRAGCRTRAVIDTAPLLERDFARRAGLGWFGKNTMLINRRVGSWLFLGALLTDVELTPDAVHQTSHCGTCTRCLDACPTDAFVEPYVLDARRCISYLTIELRDQPIPTELRTGMGDWVFGCDVCQEVCPWNRKAAATTVPEFRPQPDLAAVELSWLLAMSEEDFKERFRRTPQERPGRAGLLRNAAIAAGNSGDPSLIPALESCLHDDELLVRDAARWALERLTAIGDNPS